MNRQDQCPGSHVRVMLSLAEECAKRARCPRCHRTLGIRPARGSYTTFGNRVEVSSGWPSATIPAHKGASV